MLDTIGVSTGPERLLAGEEATRGLAADLADTLAPGDVIALSGDLGVGKTTFARALIRQLAGDQRLEVPSPTFTLVQTYDLLRFPVVHVDLYRVNEPSELLELGFGDFASGAALLIEWPEHAGALLPQDRLEIVLALAPEEGPEHRRLSVRGHGALASRAHRLVGMHRFLEEAGVGGAARVRLQGDASTRIYERLTQNDHHAILMIAPRRPDGPPIKDGRSYSAIAHLAEDVVPFVALARALRERGISAPEIQAADLTEGLLVLEDLGAEPMVAGNPPTALDDRYAAALEVLVALHRMALPDKLPVAPSVSYQLPRYDLDALMIEVELLLDWYLPQQEIVVSEEARAEFAELWREALAAAVAAPPTWVLRDYHSPNLLWLAKRKGIARVGVLDFQDAVLGPAAYDVVSLLQDARVDVPETLEDALVSRYMKGRKAADRDFDLGQFVALYSLMGAQRATKILGIFARLARRDGKPQYIRHQSRVWRNLRRSLSHPTLTRLKAWYEAHVPAPRSG